MPAECPTLQAPAACWPLVFFWRTQLAKKDLMVRYHLPKKHSEIGESRRRKTTSSDRESSCLKFWGFRASSQPMDTPLIAEKHLAVSKKRPRLRPLLAEPSKSKLENWEGRLFFSIASVNFRDAPSCVLHLTQPEAAPCNLRTCLCANHVICCTSQ